MDDHSFCCLLLRETRRQVKVAVPQLCTWGTKIGNNKWFEVRDNAGKMIWQGSAHCAFEAKANAIDHLEREAKDAEA